MLPRLDIDRTRAYPPRVTAFTQTFWSGLQNGECATTRCDACDKLAIPPKPICPHCWSTRLTWTPLSGLGRLYSQTVVHAGPTVFASEIPYRVGIVDLDEGVRLATRIIADTEPALDAAVEIVTLAYRDGPLFAARVITP